MRYFCSYNILINSQEYCHFFSKFHQIGKFAQLLKIGQSFLENFFRFCAVKTLKMLTKMAATIHFVGNFA